MPSRPISSVIENKRFATTTAKQTVRKAAELMREFHQVAVLVVAGERLVGICTERDVVFKVVAAGGDPDKMTVAEIMTPDPVSITPDKPFGHALHLMFEGGFRNVPVTDAAGKVLGLVTARDALGLDVLQFEKELLLREGLAEIL